MRASYGGDEAPVENLAKRFFNSDCRDAIETAIQETVDEIAEDSEDVKPIIDEFHVTLTSVDGIRV